MATKMMSVIECHAEPYRGQAQSAYKNRRRLDLGSGVYILFKGRLAVYVGQARCISKRVAQHIGVKDFDSYGAIYSPIESLTRIEELLITLLDPPLNRTGGERINGKLVKLRPIKFRDE